MGHENGSWVDLPRIRASEVARMAKNDFMLMVGSIWMDEFVEGKWIWPDTYPSTSRWDLNEIRVVRVIT